jgi:hypothetical protein
MTRNVQLLAFRFGAGAQFEGQLVGALERAESGGTLRIRDVLFVGRDPDSGDLVAIDAAGKGQGSVVSALLGFRLDAAARRRSTERALRAYGEDDGANPLVQLAEPMQPGEAIAAVLVEHVWAHAVDDAVERTGGAALLSAFVDATRIAELTSELGVAATRARDRPAPA